MKNFAMLYEMKEKLQEFRKAFYRLDPEWQEWISKRINLEGITAVYDELENIEIFEMRFEPADIEQVAKIRRKK